jgi:pimeloyl-ACP methyl ester carboxylesterase
MPQLKLNGAELYYEVCGGGPPVLLIMGFTGDAGHFETLAGARQRVHGHQLRPAGERPKSPPARVGGDKAGGTGRRRGRAARRTRSISGCGLRVPAPARTSLFAC